MNLKRLCLGLTLLCGGALGLFGQNYAFDGKISREVLENYLARAITMQELYRSPTVDDDIRMLKNIGAKFVGRSIYLWGGEGRIADPAFLAQGKEMAERIHRNDPDAVLQAAVFEIVTQQGVGQVPVPDWVFREFAQTPEARSFDYSKMLFPDNTFVDHWGRGSSVPDIRQMETKMWFFFLAASYMNVGIEAIHFGQLDLIGRDDPEYRNWADLLRHVRGYAANHARRHWVLCDAHVPKAGPVVDGKLLLDVHAFPLRPKEVADSPEKAVLQMGYSDSIYGRSNGGIAPSGWQCEHLPYLVEFDNFGGSRTAGQASQASGASIFTWGYDEITWFSQQPEPYRNEWLGYAWNWLKEHDRNGFLEMPGGRMLTNGPTLPGEGGRATWYFANTKSPACPRGFGQEETIKAIWMGKR